MCLNPGVGRVAEVVGFRGPYRVDADQASTEHLANSRFATARPRLNLRIACARIASTYRWFLSNRLKSHLAKVIPFHVRLGLAVVEVIRRCDRGPATAVPRQRIHHRAG